jgi:hypothetical protein
MKIIFFFETIYLSFLRHKKINRPLIKTKGVLIY